MSDGPGRKPRVTDEEILQLFQEADDPVLSTGEVTAQLPIKRSGAYKRLKSLCEEGRLRSKQIDGKNTVYWLDEGAENE
jgi:DNA-binding IclR family transcriptional regulator